MSAASATRAVPALVAVLAVLVPAASSQTTQPAKVVLRQGDIAFEWIKGFGVRPDGKRLGNTHGAIAIDSQGRVYFNTDTADAIMVFEPDGRFVRSFGKDFAGGLRGMLIRKEGDADVLYLAHTGRHEVVKMTLDEKILVRFPWPEASGKYTSKDQFAPTSIAVAPNGEVFVADGYGQSWIHQYAADGSWMQTFGGPGTEPGKLRTPHGLFIDTRGKDPVLVVADRENGRIQLFDLNGKFLRELKGDVRRPCNMDVWGKLLVVADLCGRITLFDENWKAVAQLGDNPDQSKWAQNGVPSKDWQDGFFIAPHSAKFDAKGNLYVMDWLSEGRVTKLERIAAGK